MHAGDTTAVILKTLDLSLPSEFSVGTGSEKSVGSSKRKSRSKRTAVPVVYQTDTPPTWHKVVFRPPKKVYEKA